MKIFDSTFRPPKRNESGCQARRQTESDWSAAARERESGASAILYDCLAENRMANGFCCRLENITLRSCFVVRRMSLCIIIDFWFSCSGVRLCFGQIRGAEIVSSYQRRHFSAVLPPPRAPAATPLTRTQSGARSGSRRHAQMQTTKSHTQCGICSKCEILITTEFKWNC